MGGFYQKGSFFYFAILISILPLDFAYSKAKAVFTPPGPPCPHFMTQHETVPTTPYKSECRLHRDVVGVVETLHLTPGIQLDCQNHKITPVARGILGDPTSRSVPETAIFMEGGPNSQVRNCRIEGFDHGILAANHKVPASIREGPESLSDVRNEIAGNDIDARFVSVHLVSADNFWIRDNRLTWRTKGGAGVLVHHDADFAVIRDNRITGNFQSGAQGAVLMPGPASSTNPVFFTGHGALLALQVLGPHPQLFNAVVNNRLFQFRTTDSPVPDQTFTEQTLIEGNDVFFPQLNLAETEDGIVVSNTIETTIRDNVVGDPDLHSVRAAIRAGSITGANRQFPGSCGMDPERLCLSDFDCHIPGVDMESKGSCSLPPPKLVFWIPLRLAIEDNVIYGPFFFGIGTAGRDARVSDNVIHGPMRGGGMGGIVLAGKDPLETAAVTRNTLSGISRAFHLMGAQTADYFGAAISLNDVTGYDVSVFLAGSSPFPIRLSADENGAACGPNSILCRGNYWGLAECPGFDPGTVRPLGSDIGDPYAYLEAVALLPQPNLPLNCGQIPE